MKKLSRALLTAVTLSALAVGALDAQADTNKPGACNIDDASKVRSVMQFLHSANQAEIKLGKLAQTKSQNADVKAFADHMVKDHVDADKKLSDLAAKQKIDLAAAPTDPLYVAAVAMHDALAQELGGKSGAAFDVGYLAGQPADHLLVLKMIEEGQKAAKDPEAKKGLDDAHAMVAAHKEHADKTVAKLQLSK